MIQIGKFNRLQIANLVSFGAYLDAGTGNRNDNILLPEKQRPKDAGVGDFLDVFIYRDSENRLIATTRTPMAQVGELAYLTVTAKTGIGAFLEIGLERGLFLPFREQKYPIEVGKSYLVYVYIDKSERLCGTTDITSYLSSNAAYQKNESVTGTVYQIHPKLGAFVAVDNQFKGLIPSTENFIELHPGDKVQARVIRVREDGKLDLSTRRLSYQQMSVDAQFLLKAMQENEGNLPLDEKASPGEIEKIFKMSKSEYKRAIGSLLKSGRIQKTEKGFSLKFDQ
ncbi:CvfB family protein [Desulfitobacterium sp. AusDCA]|uniref:CvfB family protein n=1 Tax=Desulfitobacterium sp. AusDCA TaxID=3240383 RepID=UPI003DA79E9A